MSAPMRRATDRATPETRAAFGYFVSIGTRWKDNDVYGHVNNVEYYSWFDTAVNEFLIKSGVLDIASGTTIGVVAESQCTYLSPIAFPDRVAVGLKVAKLGMSSVRYRIAIFRGDDATASAQGSFMHVYVDRATRRPVALPETLRRALEKIA